MIREPWFLMASWYQSETDGESLIFMFSNFIWNVDKIWIRDWFLINYLAVITSITSSLLPQALPLYRPHESQVKCPIPVVRNSTDEKQTIDFPPLYSRKRHSSLFQKREEKNFADRLIIPFRWESKNPEFSL